MDFSRHKVTPRYYRIYEELHNQIASGQYPAGQKMPSETELCRIYGVSRGTIREAVKMLMQEGLLKREQGRGTFVLDKKVKIAQNAKQLIGFTELMQQHGKKAAAKILRIETKKPGQEVRGLLEMKPSEKVVEIERLRFGDDAPLIIERSCFVYGYFYPLLEFDLEKESIYEVLHRETDVRLGDAYQTIEAVNATAGDARLLQVEPDTALLLIKRLIKTKSGRFFQYSEDRYRADKLNFTIHTKTYDEHQHGFATPLNIQTKTD